MRRLYQEKVEEEQINKQVEELKQKYDEKKLIKPNEEEEAEEE